MARVERLKGEVSAFGSSDRVFLYEFEIQRQFIEEFVRKSIVFYSVSEIGFEVRDQLLGLEYGAGHLADGEKNIEEEEPEVDGGGTHLLLVYRVIKALARSLFESEGLPEGQPPDRTDDAATAGRRHEQEEDLLPHAEVRPRLPGPKVQPAQADRQGHPGELVEVNDNMSFLVG